MDISYTALKE